MRMLKSGWHHVIKLGELLCDALYKSNTILMERDLNDNDDGNFVGVEKEGIAILVQREAKKDQGWEIKDLACLSTRQHGFWRPCRDECYCMRVSV